MGSNEAPTRKSERSLVKITIGCAIVLSSIFYVTNTYYVHKDDFITPILSADINDLDEIVIRPWHAYKKEYNLVQKDISVKSRSEKSHILAALNVAKPFDPSHPYSKWKCVLTLKKKREKYSCTVSRTDNMGVLINFWSFGGYWGFHLKEYRSDSLGKILELIVNNQEK